MLDEECCKEQCVKFVGELLEVRQLARKRLVKIWQLEHVLGVLLKARRIKETEGKTPEYKALKKQGWELAKKVVE